MTSTEIIKQVSDATGVSVENILSKKRGKTITAARHLAMRRLKTELGLGYSRIARAMNRDHATVWAVIQKKE